MEHKANEQRLCLCNKDVLVFVVFVACHLSMRENLHSSALLFIFHIQSPLISKTHVRCLERFLLQVFAGLAQEEEEGGGEKEEEEKFVKDILVISTYQ